MFNNKTELNRFLTAATTECLCVHIVEFEEKIRVLAKEKDAMQYELLKRVYPGLFKSKQLGTSFKVIHRYTPPQQEV